MTYNIHHGEGMDGHIDMERIAQVIRSAQPDVVCLQEVDQGTCRTNGIDMPATLSRLLDMEVAYAPNLEYQGGCYGNAILSRYPIQYQDNLSLPRQSGGEQRGCQRAVLDIDGETVTVLNTHLGLDAAIRKKQASAILDWIAPTADPVFLLGDLNETPEGPALALILSRFQDSYTGEGDEGTLSGSANRRIDYVLASRDLSVVSSRIISDERAAMASDHLPVVATIALGGPDTTRDARGITYTDQNRLTEAAAEGEY